MVGVRGKYLTTIQQFAKVKTVKRLTEFVRPTIRSLINPHICECKTKNENYLNLTQPNLSAHYSKILFDIDKIVSG